MADLTHMKQELIAPKRAWWFIGLLLLSCAGLCGLALLLPHDRYVRFQQLTDSDLFRSRWVYERIHFDPTPIDVAVIGSSRVEAAISAPDLEKALSEKAGRPIHVANLAIPDEGRNLHYVVAKELFASRRETKLILLSVVEQANISHPAFRYLADSGDILRSPLMVNHSYFLDAAFLPYRQFSYFFQSLHPEWFGKSRRFRDDYMKTDFDTTYSFRLPSGKLVDRFLVAKTADLNRGAAKTMESLGGGWTPPSRWRALNEPLEPEFTRRLVGLAESNCARVIFVRLPFYSSGPGTYDRASYERLGPVLDAQRYSDIPHYYSDSGHFNRFGTDRVSHWLAEQLDPYIDSFRSTTSGTR